MIPLKSLFGNQGNEMPPPEEPSTSSSNLRTTKDKDNPQNHHQVPGTSKSQRILVASKESGPGPQQAAQNHDKQSNLEDLDEDDWSKKYWEVITRVETGIPSQKPDLSKFQSPTSFWRKTNGVDEELLTPLNAPPTESQNEENHVAENLEEQRAPNSPLREREDGRSVNRASRDRARRNFLILNWNRFPAPEQPLSVSTKREPDEKKEESSDTALFTFVGKASSCKKKKRTRIFDVWKGFMSFILRKLEERRKKRRQMLQSNRQPITVYQKQWIPAFVLHVLDIYYYLCLSPYNREPVDPQESWRKKLPHYIQKLVFGLIVFLATWKIVNDLHYYFLTFLKEQKPVDIFDIVFCLSMAFMQYSFVYFVTFQQEKLSKVLKAWGYFGAITQNADDANETDSKSYWSFTCVAILYAIGLLPSIMRIILYDGFNKWNLKDLLLQRGTDFQYDWATWRNGKSLNATEFYIQSGNQAATSTYFCGIIQIFMNISYEMLLDAARNLVIVVALVNYIHVQRFGKRVQKCLLSMLPFLNNKREDVKCWIFYRDTKHVNNETNDTFGPTLIFNHQNNTMILTFIMVSCLKKDANYFYVAFYLFQMGKALCAYYIARRTVTHNKTTQKWIKTMSCHSQQFLVGTVPYSRELMLNELKEEPLGLGSEQFAINDAFLYKMFGTAFSILGLLLSLKYIDQE